MINNRYITNRTSPLKFALHYLRAVFDRHGLLRSHYHASLEEVDKPSGRPPTACKNTVRQSCRSAVAKYNQVGSPATVVAMAGDTRSVAQMENENCMGHQIASGG